MKSGCKVFWGLIVAVWSLVSFGGRVTILHTNDIHGKIGRKGALAYAQVAAYRDRLRARGEAVFPAYSVVTAGTTRVAVVGLATPETPTLSSANAPLRQLSGYLLDYENREGSGRIVER